MSSGFANVAPRHVRALAFVLVGMICVVPALVRATYSPSVITPIRLNRGFDAPPSKVAVVPPTDSVICPLLDQAPPTLDRSSGHAPEVDDRVAPVSPDSSPDPLRGPPTVSRT